MNAEHLKALALVVLMLPMSTLTGLVIARALYYSYVRYAFQLFATRRLSENIALAYLWVITVLYMQSVMLVGVASGLRARATEMESFVLLYPPVVTFGIGFGFWAAYMNIAISQGGVSLLLHSFTRSRGTILTFRKFWDENSKRVVEEVLPLILNQFAKFTIIEAPGEYVRQERDHLVPNLFANVFPWIDYTEVYLRSASRYSYEENDWKSCARSDIEGAQFVLVDVSSTSESVLWEIKTSQMLATTRVVYIARDCSTSRESVSWYEAKLGGPLCDQSAPVIYYPEETSDQYVSGMKKFVRLISQRLISVDSSTFDSGRILTVVQFLGCTCVAAWAVHKMITISMLNNIILSCLAVIVVPLALARTRVRQLSRGRDIMPARNQRVSSGGAMNKLWQKAVAFDPALKESPMNNGRGEEESPEHSFRFYTPTQVAVGAMAGTPMAAGLLLAMNYWKLRKHYSAALTLSGGVIGGFLDIYVGNQMLPILGQWTLGLHPMVVAVVIFPIARVLQGAECQKHLDQNGKRGYWVLVIAIGLFFNIFSLAWFSATLTCVASTYSESFSCLS